jgi:hypothetical protein
MHSLFSRGLPNEAVSMDPHSESTAAGQQARWACPLLLKLTHFLLGRFPLPPHSGRHTTACGPRPRHCSQSTAGCPKTRGTCRQSGGLKIWMTPNPSISVRQFIIREPIKMQEPQS